MKSESEVAQSRPTLSDPMDRSPPGSSVHGIFQARALEWGAIAFSDATSIVSKKKLPYNCLLISFRYLIKITKNGYKCSAKIVHHGIF